MGPSTTIIEKKSRLKLVDWKELADYRDLLYFLIVRGIRAKYAQSVLGVSWAVIQPLFTMLVFTIVFGNLAKISSDGVPYALFSFSALMPWTYFSGVLNEASNSLTTNANMLSKVYFPRIVLPLAAMLGKLLDFSITLLVMGVLLVMFNYMPSYQLVFLPLLLLYLLMTALGPSLILAAWSVQYRDIKYAMTFIVQLLMYAAPVVYPLSLIPQKYQLWYALNPLVGVIEGFRAAILGTSAMPWPIIGIGFSMSWVILMVGLYTFSRLERTFADVA
ncbi:MAG: ABC transporter permease [Cyclobacteriaceae bacterium]|nr:ABC transporter permease [Flammeovirgaceae bacterium]MCO5272576.1 ABC transporter permease [Cyclobacteriaceae bacterium]